MQQFGTKNKGRGGSDGQFVICLSISFLIIILVSGVGLELKFTISEVAIGYE